MDNGQHFTFCCFDNSDLNSHFKNLNTSNTSLTLGEPRNISRNTHFPPCLPSTENMCEVKNYNSEPRIHLTGNPEFSEFQVITMAFIKQFHLHQ